MKHKTSHFFLLSASGVLLFTALAKVVSTFGKSGILVYPDPITGVSFSHLLIATSGIEFVVAGVCAFGKSRPFRAMLVAWLATSFLAYRVGLHILGWHRPCSCLGNLTDAIHISPQVADNVMKGVLAYLLAGSYWILFSHWRKSKLSQSMVVRQNARV